ncbi:hypothetical protein HRbin21_00851 [bacterium HR21]|nr:hypothetical protein HRbin21_00851 [bacterium HR21]
MRCALVSILVVLGTAGSAWAQTPGLIARQLHLTGELFLGIVPNPGTTGQLLVSQGIGAAPVWAAQLFWDNTASRLGIGTANPQATLDVVGTLRAIGFQLPTGAAAGYILQSDASGNASWVSPAGLVNVTASNGLSKVGTDIQLGGTLTASTDINLAGKVLSFSGGTSSGVAIGTSSPPATTARLYVTSASNSYDAIRAVHTSTSTTAAYAAIGGQLSGSGYTSVTGYLGYHATNNKTFGVRTVGGDYGAWFDKPLAVMPSTTPPGSTADLEVRNTTAGAPVQLLFRQTASNTSAGAVLVSVDFGDNSQLGAQAQIRALRGAAASTGSLPTDLSFATTPVGSTTPVERVRMTHSGSIGIGIATPQALLHQEAAAGSYHKFTAGSTTGTAATDGFDIGVAADGTAEVRQRETAELRFYTGDQLRMRLLPTGELVLHHQLIAQSSRRFKEAVRPIEAPMELVRRLRGVRFRWKPEYGGADDLGLLAEEVAAVVPEIVQRDAAGEVLGVDYTRLVAVLIEALKELEARIEHLEKLLHEVLPQQGHR